MIIRNKVIATVFLEDGCNQEDDEVSKHWKPVNFDIYSELFPDLIIEAIDEWLSTKKLVVNRVYELILAHEVEHDAGGAVLGEQFLVIHEEVQDI